MSKDSPWPDGCRGALSLTFDDGISSQLDYAIPLMKELGLRGTFFLCPRGDEWRENAERWRPAFEAGHEIGNHSLSHTCSRAFSDDPRATGLETMTLADIEADVVEAERRLSEAFPAEARAYCYPCYQAHVGEGLTRQSYVPVIAKHFIAARAGGEIANHPATCDLHYLWSWTMRGTTGPEMVGLAEQCAAQGRWGVLTFHGIHEGHLSVADVDFRELCHHLHRSKHIWVAPMAEIATAITSWRKSGGTTR